MNFRFRYFARSGAVPLASAALALGAAVAARRL